MEGLDSHAAALTPETRFSRRGFVMTGLTAGFALAVQPVSAQTITTDTNGLTAGEVKIPVADGEIPAYRALPQTGGPFATILVIQEIFGVHEHIKDICRRLAKAGYFAVAPALYARQGDPSKLSDISQIIKTIVAKVPDAEVTSDLDATLAWAGRQEHTDIRRLGVTGFCWGGRQTWLYAVHNPAVKAAVAWYGPLDGAPDALRPKPVLEAAAALKVPVLGLYGGADQSIPLADVEKMRAVIKATGTGSEIVVYPDAPHGFNADYRPSYRPAAAKDGWTRMLAWFKEHGV
ncbi:MAG TPA: dienelactone hydrolase family protein [Stellaceae bacterium]|jgi:carboxymethylenebutenolidase|nr:dienelactone hydrolase family protein [Stellaceae bacterium]